jgi:hypothetical protein
MRWFFLVFLCIIPIAYADWYDTNCSFTPTKSNATYNLTQNISVIDIHVGEYCFNITSDNAWNGTWCYNFTNATTIWMDNETPIVNNLYPANNSNISGGVTFAFNASDYFPQVAILYGNFSGAWGPNQTLDSWYTDTNTTFSELTGLSGVYIWGVFINDSAGQSIWSDNYTINISGNAVSNIAVTATLTTATITYDTALSTPTTLYYGLVSGSLSSLFSDTDSATSHTAYLSGLSEDTTYYYVIESCVGATCTNISERNFTTGEMLTGGGGNIPFEMIEELSDGSIEIEFLDGKVCTNRRTRIRANIYDVEDNEIEVDRLYFLVGNNTYKMWDVIGSYLFIDDINLDANFDNQINFTAVKNMSGMTQYLSVMEDVETGICTYPWLGFEELSADMKDVLYKKLSFLGDWKDMTIAKKINITLLPAVIAGIIILGIIIRKEFFKR